MPSVLATLAARDDAPSTPVGNGQVDVVLAIPASRSADEPLTRRATALSAWPWSTAFAAVWIAGAIVGLSRLGWGLWRLSWLAAHARPLVSCRLAREAGRLAASMRVGSHVRLLEARGVPWLVTWGARHPTVLLPEEARRWTDARVAIVLRHEFAHIVRRDWLAQMLAETVRALHWFNPLVWLACRRVRQEAERACDDDVLRAGVHAADYASHLLDAARTASAGAPRPALAMSRASGLERRITAMLNARTNRAPLAPAARLAILIGMLSVTVPVALAEPRLSSLDGTVVDPVGRPMADAGLVLTSEATRATLETRTDATGHFLFAGLPTGAYQLAIAKPGFKAYKETLAIGAQDATRAIHMQIGAVSESITVKAGTAAPGQAPRAPVSDAARQRAEEARQQRTAQCTASSSGGQIVPPTKLIDVRPEYPASLLGSRTEGVVKIAGILGADGRISATKVVSSPHPDLAWAATDAVRQWDFTPTLLNCRPIDIEVGVTITFVAP